MAVDYTFTPPASAPLDPGASRSHKPKVLMAQFGDGFSQRAADGPNNDALVRKFSWTNLTEDEKDVIDEFFVARNGWQSFYYTPTDEPQRVYICTEWDVVRVAYDVYTVTASFQQVFDL